MQVSRNKINFKAFKLSLAISKMLKLRNSRIIRAETDFILYFIVDLNILTAY